MSLSSLIFRFTKFYWWKEEIFVGYTKLLSHECKYLYEQSIHARGYLVTESTIINECNESILHQGFWPHKGDQCSGTLGNSKAPQEHSNNLTFFFNQSKLIWGTKIPDWYIRNFIKCMCKSPKKFLCPVTS